MNQSERDEAAKIIAKMADIFGKTMTRPEITSYINALESLDVNLDSLHKSFNLILKDQKQRFFPAPIELKRSQTMDSREMAIALARKIDLAVKTYGYTWSLGVYSGEHGQNYYIGGGSSHWTFKEAVIAELGPIGWHYVCGMGGWDRVRDSANTQEEGIFIAQTRDFLQASYALQEKGIDLTQVSLPSSNETLQIGNDNKFIDIKIKSIE